MKQTHFISKEEIFTIELSASLQYWLIVLMMDKGIWYAKSFTADQKGIHGDFYDERF